MSVEAEANQAIQEELKTLGKEPEFLESMDLKSLSIIDEYGKRLWSTHVKIKFMEYKYPEQKEIIKERSLELLKTYFEINKKIGEHLLKIIPKSEEENIHFKDLVAEKFIVASQKAFDFLQEKEIKSSCLLEEKDGIKFFKETESSYYVVKRLIRDAQTIYDDLAVYFLSKNDFEKAHLYYFLLGELLIKEISYGKNINDWMLYDDYEFGDIYYNAGLAFMRCYKSLKDRYIMTHYGAPAVSYIHSAISEVFATGNIGLPPEELAIKSFESAKPFLLKTGNKITYSKIIDYLYELKSELNDFEKNILELIIKIAKEFSSRKNIVIKKTSKNIQEGDVRDYFLSVTNVVIKEIAVAENAEGLGFSDLTIFGKDNFRNNLKTVSEFKVWSRNDYKNVINQVKSYLTDFESFGIIVMINEGKESIKTRYREEIINKDLLMVENSFEEINFGNTEFGYFKTKSFMDASKTKSISIYHLILNVGSLLDKNQNAEPKT